MFEVPQGRVTAVYIFAKRPSRRRSSLLGTAPRPFAFGSVSSVFLASIGSVCFVNGLAADDGAHHFRGKDLLRGNVSDVPVQHNQVRPLSRN